ncbi:hypothetical protein [Paraburkholderia sacchari]|uniref:hypothetical protein n=1 Tax=Paraburkholderia sacchari TaxID=159450 RepID=UPI003D98FD47
MTSFKRPKRNVDRAALERFVKGTGDRRAALAATPVPAASSPSEAAAPAKDSSSTASAPPVAVAPTVTAPQIRTVERLAQPEPVAYDKHQQIQWRVSQSTRDLFERVYKNTNVKSKQQLLDSILLPALELMDEKSRQN